ncbi:MAG: tandem-95 repeat protein [Erythrobacter sp.]|nr:tandem-95 repeat protein [Erythrobacter sp.]
MDSFETRNEFADAQGSDNASESQVTDIQGNPAQAMNLRNVDIVLRPDADGVVVLPEGASLDNMTAQGRDLVIVLEDGTRIVIPEGAIIVPQIVIDGVTVPAANLAALLTGNEPQPAAGDPQSSGGNFEVDPGNIQAAYDLGDLLPYTELAFPQPEEREIIPSLVDRDPDVVIETPDNPVGVVNAIATVDEDGLPARTVGGASEPEGTRSETNSETASGTIVFNAPDGVGSVLINGVAITSVGQTFQGETGTLTITSIDLANGRIGFSFTLEDNMVGGEIDGSFMMSVIDADGDRADANLQIRIIDDAPIAVDDANSVAAGTFGPIAGSVLVNDESGADGYAAGGAVTGFANDGGSAEPGDTLVGTYGELTLNADGSYSYTRYFNTPGGVSEEFTYTITDADGSTSTATLTIDIGDANDAITNVPDGEDATVVDEDELPPTTGTRDDEPAGSDFDGDDETASGTITFTSPDGVGSVTIGGTVVDPENLPQVVVADDTGTLTVIDYTYDPETGEGTITYEYELTDNTGDPEGTTVDFPIVVIDLDGDVAEDDLVITIVDDVPEAFDDTGAQGEENAPITVDALDNDITGADGVDLATGVAVVDGTLSGDGSVSYNGDGTFTYTPGAGEEGTVTFDYTITDGDGDTSTATVTITLQPDSAPEIAVEGQDTVFEEALGARGDEPAGSNAASDGEFASGSIAIATGGDSIDSLIVNGVDVTDGGTVTTERGVLTVSVTDGAYSYSYELTDNTLVDPDSDSFTLVVTDSDGDTAQTTLVVSIVDDNPSAADDANAISAGEYGPVGGNVLANDIEGADGALVTSYTGANGTGSAGDTIQGEYGTLTIAADGSYSYTRNPGTEGGVSDSFTYTITDGDGDTATANLVIAIADSPVVVDLPVAGGDGTLVDEAGLPAGSDAASDSEFTSGAFTYDAPDGPATVTIGGQTVTAVGQTINGSFGTLTITSIAEGSIGYTYELTTNTDGDDTFDSFEVIVTDQDGDVASGDLDIAIIDDVPTAVADTDSVTEDGPLTADGNVITDAEANGDNGGDTTGADGASVTDVSFGGSPGTVGGATAGSYGSLVLNADGSYTYTLDNTNEFVQGLDSTESLTEVFTYTLIDGDGDTSVTTLTVTINGDDDIVTLGGLDLETPELTVDEDDLADGSSPDAAALTPSGDFTVDSPDGLDTLTVGGVQVWGGGESYPISIPGAYGTVNVTGVTVTTDANGDVVAATVSYEYELSDNTLDHMADGEDQLVDSLEVVATDSDGSEDTASLDIAVVDDVPTAVDDGAAGVGNGIAVAEDTATLIDVFANDEAGADDVASGDIALASDGANGTAVYNGDGTFTYTPNPGYAGLDSFTYTITDGDGDTSTATVYVEVAADSVPAFDAGNATVDEDGLAGANVDSNPLQVAPTETDSTEDNTATVNFTVDYGNDTPGDVDAAIAFINPDSLDAQLSSGGQPVDFALDGGDLVGTIDGGATEVVRITLNAGTDNGDGTVDYSYTVTLSEPLDHADDESENTQLLNGVTIQVTDSDGTQTPDTFTVTIVDDVPQNFTPVDLTDASNNTVTTQDDVLMNTGTASATRLLNDTDNDGVGENFMGADGFGTLEFTNGTDGDILQDAGVNVTSEGNTIYLFGFGTGSLVATTDSTNTDAGAVVFTVTLDAGTANGSDASYTIDFDKALDDGSAFVIDDFSAAPAGQNEWIGLDFDGNDIDLDSNDSQDLLLTGINGTVNTSASDIGADNQWVDAGEGTQIDYVIDVARDGASDEKVAQGYTFDQHYDVSFASFSVLQLQGGGTASVQIRVYSDGDGANLKNLADGSSVDIDGSSIVVRDSGGNVLTESVDYDLIDMGDGYFVLTGIDAGDNIYLEGVTDFNQLQITNASGELNPDTPAPGDTFGGTSFSIGAFGYDASQAGSPIDLSFDVLATDGDGDTSTGTIDVTLVPAVAPIVLDLDGDGVEFLGMDAGVAYDYGGGLVTTAWVAPDDGLLVHDANGNGAADNGTEIVFGGNGLTDLEGLAAKHDTNRDGVLDAKDADFASFGVWQDTNSNGVTDDGEFSTLTEAGISSIALVSDGDAYTVFDGDVLVHGEGEFTYADGSTGIFADAAFAVSPTAKTSTDPRTAMRPMEMATVAAMASGFFMPEMQAQFDQTFGDPASAHRDMVDFEFAPIADVRAPELPEAEALSFDSLGPTDQAVSSEPAMANILEGQSAFKAPQADLAGSLPDESVNFAQSMDAGPQLAGGPSVFEGFAGGDAASGMEALLMLEAPAKLAEAGPAAEAGEALGEAVADIAAEAAVDAIVDHFAANDGPAVAVAPPEGLLDSMIGNDVALHAMGMMPQDQNDEAAALAAAAA